LDLQLQCMHCYDPEGTIHTSLSACNQSLYTMTSTDKQTDQQKQTNKLILHIISYTCNKL